MNRIILYLEIRPCPRSHYLHDESRIRVLQTVGPRLQNTMHFCRIRIYRLQYRSRHSGNWWDPNFRSAQPRLAPARRHEPHDFVIRGSQKKSPDWFCRRVIHLATGEQFSKLPPVEAGSHQSINRYRHNRPHLETFFVPDKPHIYKPLPTPQCLRFRDPR